MNLPQQRPPIRIKGIYRILCFSLTSRPIYLTHGAYKKIITLEKGRIELAGNPLHIDIEFSVKIDTPAFWKGRAVNKLIDLDTYQITSLAPGIVPVNGLRSPFLFYGNCWFQLSGETINNEEPNEDEDGQRRFMTAINKMENDRNYDRPGVVPKKVASSNSYDTPGAVRKKLRLTPIQRNWQGDK